MKKSSVVLTTALLMATPAISVADDSSVNLTTTKSYARQQWEIGQTKPYRTPQTTAELFLYKLEKLTKNRSVALWESGSFNKTAFAVHSKYEVGDKVSVSGDRSNDGYVEIEYVKKKLRFPSSNVTCENTSNDMYTKCYARPVNGYRSYLIVDSKKLSYEEFMKAWPK
jgi:hypothetical protein